MKKVVSFVLAALFIFSCMSAATVSALSDELLENPGFEESDEEGWMLYGKSAIIEVSDEYAHTGDYGLLIGDRGERYSTYNQVILKQLTEGGPGKYEARMWVKLKEELEGKDQCGAQLVIRITDEGATNPKYYTSAKITLTTEWQECKISAKLDFQNNGKLNEARIYPQCFVDYGDNSYGAPDIVVDDFSLKKVDPINGVKYEVFEKTDVEPISVTDVKKDGLATVGAIRWDAWYTHDGNPQSVVSQVEKTLSPAKYHWRAPFFANVTDKGNIEFPEYTQEIFDKEMEYAIEAGVDYFAYCWYNSDMKAARIFHTKSKYRDQVKLCPVMDGNSICQKYAREEMETLLKESYFMTVLDGRPLMYYFASNDNIEKIAEDISYYRQLAEKIGVKPPFAVVMNVGTNKVKEAGGDAVSKYGFSGASGLPFDEYLVKNREMWDGWASSSMQLVPAVSLGWHPQPRYENPVTWTKVTADSWVEYATSEQCGEAVAQGLEYMTSLLGDPLTKANTIIIYGWNEHDEGGWFCPTIAVDENGNQLYNDDGSKKIDTTRLEAVKKTVESYKAGTLVTKKDTVTATAEPIAEATAAPSEILTEDKKSNAWIYIVGGAVIVAGVITVAVVVVKKKKKNG